MNFQAYLCHESCEDTGLYIDSAAGWAGKYEIVRSKGSLLRKSKNDGVSIEDVGNVWEKVKNMDGATKLGSIEEATGSLLTALEEMDSVASSTSEKATTGDVYKYNSRDVIIYALGG